MKITFPNKEQAREAMDQALKLATKYRWKNTTTTANDCKTIKELCDFMNK